LTDLTLNI